MNGVRNNAIIGQDIDLIYQFRLNSQPFDAFEVKRVEIYSSEVDAVAGLNILETINGVDIEKIIAVVGQPEILGRYSCTVSGRDTAGTYFDKWIITPRDGYPDFSDIEQFYVRVEEWGGGPGEIPKKSFIYGYVEKMFGSNQNIPVRVKLNKSTKYNNEVTVLSKTSVVKSDASGFWSIELITTAYMPATAYYEIAIDDLIYKKTVPDQASANLYQLPDYAGI